MVELVVPQDLEGAAREGVCGRGDRHGDEGEDGYHCGEGESVGGCYDLEVKDSTHVTFLGEQRDYVID